MTLEVSSCAGAADGRIAVIGDVGGHLEALERELINLGADPETMVLPADLTIVQVGDLVHRGPDSEGVVTLIDQVMCDQPSQWVQLVGNHEAQYVADPVFEWPEQLDHTASDVLQRWWMTGRLVAAVAVRDAHSDYLITHAGLTHGFWREVLDCRSDVRLIALALNSFIRTHEDVLFASGQMLGGGGPNLAAGPIWAAAGSELVPSWWHGDDAMPFSQVHGHSMIWDRSADVLRCAPQIAEHVVIDAERAHESVQVPGGQSIIGVDPGHGKDQREPWHALVLANAVVL